MDEALQLSEVDVERAIVDRSGADSSGLTIRAYAICGA
jgi:hypothetical protein